MAITIEQVKSARIGARLHLEPPFGRPCDGRNGPVIWRVNGRVREWVRTPERVEVPIKHGLYAYGTLDNGNLGRFHLEADCPATQPVARVGGWSGQHDDPSQHDG